MEGTILYPLNVVREKFPDAYAKHVVKYKDREHLLTTNVPILNCLWNDVLHFTAVPPTTLFANLQGVGYDAKGLVWKRWYKIPIPLLDKIKTVTCLYRRDVSLIPDARSFEPFELMRMEEYRTVPPETITYYREQFARGKQPLFFHRIPHILYQGTMETKELEIITL
ncbi:MAG TPA: hypothetical protein VJH94_03895 [Candidatus Paceibacterota bacterium]